MNAYKIIKHNPHLKPEEYLLNETLFHNANGYMGIRNNFEENTQGENSIRGHYINGFYDITPMPQAEKLYGFPEKKQTIVNIADTQGIKLQVDGEDFSFMHGTILTSSQTLDMKKGITKRECVWRTQTGKELSITVTRMASFAELSYFVIDYQVIPLNFSGEITLESFHEGKVSNFSDPADPRVAAHAPQYIFPTKVVLSETSSCITSRTGESGLEVSTVVSHKLNKSLTPISVASATSRSLKWQVPLTANVPFCLRKDVVVVDSRRQLETAKVAVALGESVSRVPLSEWYARQEEYLEAYWQRSEIEVSGDEQLNQALHYNLYQLLQSVGKDRFSNIAAKGLSGEGYEGHYFWDTELYMLPYFTLTQPQLAKNLIDYRFQILDHARAHAKIFGHEKGALYPWRTIMGEECSGYYPSGSAQYHINGDVAYSIVQYYLTTGDLEFIAEKGAEIIFETARLWLDVGSYVADKFVIQQVTGPDEYTCVVNNNYYTNAAAKYNLEWAGKFYDLLQADPRLATLTAKINLDAGELVAFATAAKKMTLLFDEQLRINPQDDSFLQKKVMDFKTLSEDKFPLLSHFHPLYLYRHQVCKQADTVLAHFILEDYQEYETMEKSFAYYEQVTTHDSSLSTCIFSIMASKLGQTAKAYAYFGDSALLDLHNTHNNTKDGIHTANMGGSYMAIVNGFAGLRIKESGLYFSPTLPAEWQGYHFKITYHGRDLQLTVSQEAMTIELLSGGSLTLYLYGQRHHCTGRLTVDLRK